MDQTLFEQWMQRDAADHKRIFDKLDTMDVRLDDLLSDVAQLKVKAAVWWAALSAITTGILYLLVR